MRLIENLSWFWRDFVSFTFGTCLFEIQNRWDREIFLVVSQHTSVFFARFQLFGLLHKQLLVYQIANLAETAYHNMHNNYKEDRSNANHNRFSWFLPVQERINRMVELAVSSISQKVDQGENGIAQANTSGAVKVWIHSDGMSNNHEIAKHDDRQQYMNHQIQQVKRMNFLRRAREV